MGGYKEIILCLAVGAAGGLLGARFKVPGGALVGAMLAVMFLKMGLEIEWSAPPTYRFVIQVLVGVMVGAGYTPDLARMAYKLILPVFASTLVLVGAGIILSIIFARTLEFDHTTMYIATSPGAMSSLIPVAADAQANTPVVAAFHFFRVIFILITAPLILRFLEFLAGKQ